MQIIWHYIDSGLAYIAKIAISLYQYTLSPDTGLLSIWLRGRICTHTPHCSAYARECFERYGFFRGLHYTIERVSSCTPANTTSYDPSHYSVVFFSGSPIGIPFLEKLIEDKRFDVTGVVSMPDAPAGRGMQLQENSITTTAKKYAIDVVAPLSLRTESKKYSDTAKGFVSWLEKKQPDFLVVVAYGKIIPQAILDMPRIAPINVHGSLLPAYRGASPLQSVFLHDENKTGITIMRMTAGLDEGPSIAQHEVPLTFFMTVCDLIDVFKARGPGFLNDSLWQYAKGDLSEKEQDLDGVSHTKKLTKEDALIDPFHDSIEDIYKKWKAYALWPKIYFQYDNKRVIIEHIELDKVLFHKHTGHPLLVNDQLHPAVQSLFVRPAGKKTLSWDEFIRGRKK